MKTRDKISLHEIKQNIKKFKDEVADFSMEKYEPLKKMLEGIKDDIGLILLESQDRYQERLGGRPALNKKIKEANKDGPIRKNIEYIQNNPEEFYKRLTQKVGHFKDGDLHLKKLKRGDTISDLIPEKYVPQKLITGDHYASVKADLEVKEKDIISELTQQLETAKDKVSDIYADYDNPVELLKKLGIAFKKKNYEFLAEGEGKGKLNDGGIKKTENEVPEVAPTFKKFGHIMKYINEQTPALQAKFFVHPQRGVCIYILEKNISIFVSDLIQNNKFVNATYVIRGPILEEESLTKEKLSEYQGKRIMFSDTWPRRIECAFTDNPQNWALIGEEKEEIEDVQKTLINDKSKFIAIIKEKFTPETLTTGTYKKFAEIYNEQQGTTMLINDTLHGNASLLGLGAKRSVEDIKNAIFKAKKPTLEIAKDSYFFNEHTKKTLLRIRECEGFDPDIVLGSCNYGAWVLELLRKAYNEEYVDAVKNKSMKEKKEKIEEYAGIANIPLFALKITTMLGGSTRSMDAEYQKMLRERFELYIANKSSSEKYKTLEENISVYEETWSTEGLRPNINKTEKRSKGEEKQENTSDISEKKSIKNTQPVKKIQEKAQTEVLGSLKENITLDKFPLFKVKNAEVIKETDEYRGVQIENCAAELRLYKVNASNGKTLKIGDTIEVFGARKNIEKQHIRVYIERKPGYHKVRKFLEEQHRPIQSFVIGQKYPGIINNIDNGFVRISINEPYSGRVRQPLSIKTKVGDMVEVTYNGIDTKCVNRVKLY